MGVAEKYEEEAVEKEACVVCGKETEIEVSTHIDFRENYISGAGQICEGCSYEIYLKPRIEQRKNLMAA